MAFTKVYWKGLRLVLGAAQRYINRNQAGLQKFLTTEQFTCVMSLLTAIIDCLALLPDNPEVN